MLREDSLYDKSAIIRFCGVSKKFHNSTALKNVSLSINAGKIHCILGENGAGKSTLMKILYGCYPPTSGNIYVKNKIASLNSNREAIKLGIGMVGQESGIIPELTCLENLILGEEKRNILQRKEELVEAEKIANKLGITFPWNNLASSLCLAKMKKLELLKLVRRKSEIMIFDEPTSRMNSKDTELFYTLMRQLANDGKAVIVISHKLQEVMNCADKISVLKDGVLLLSTDASKVSAKEVAKQVTGGNLSSSCMEKPSVRETCLECKNISLGLAAEKFPGSISFSLGMGEIIGITGVEGNGENELFRTIIGLDETSEGSLWFAGKDISSYDVWERKKLGFRFIGPDRDIDGSVADFDLIDNALLGIQRFPQVYRNGLLSRKVVKNICKDFCSNFSSKVNIRQSMRTLSGGNKQRFVNNKTFVFHPKLIVAQHPTNALDIEGIHDFYKRVYESCSNGAGAIIFSYDVDELFKYCHRVFVMNKGGISEVPLASKGSLGEYITGLNL